MRGLSQATRKPGSDHVLDVVPRQSGRWQVLVGAFLGQGSFTGPHERLQDAFETAV